MSKLQIVARIEYDFEKACYYLAEFEAKFSDPVGEELARRERERLERFRLGQIKLAAYRARKQAQQPSLLRVSERSN
jgi:hypothetical protein